LKSSPYTCSRFDRIVDVWKQLIELNQISAPVLNATNDKFIGFIDMADIVMKLVNTITNKDVDYDYLDLLENDDRFKKLTVYDILNEKRNPRIVLGPNHSLFYICEVFARDKNIHRIPIVDNNYKLVNMITQKQIISYFHEHIEEIGSVSKKPISYFQNVLKYVYCISQYEETINAFDKMITHSVGGVGVINSSGEIIGAISLSDLKLVSKDKEFFSKLYKTAADFMVMLDKNYWERPYALKTVTTKDTLEDVIKKLKYWNLHRIYVVDDEKKPIGVVGIKECLQEILKE